MLFVLADYAPLFKVVPFSTGDITNMSIISYGRFLNR